MIFFSINKFSVLNQEKIQFDKQIIIDNLQFIRHFFKDISSYFHNIFRTLLLFFNDQELNLKRFLYSFRTKLDDLLEKTNTFVIEILQSVRIFFKDINSYFHDFFRTLFLFFNDQELNFKRFLYSFRKLNNSWFSTCQKRINYSNIQLELVPNCKTFPSLGIEGLGPYKVKINSDGFRDREFSKIKPENVFRIVFLGDSFTFGWGVELNDSLPKQLEYLLNKRDDGVIYEVLNFGVPGMNTEQEINYFEKKVINYNPDLILLGFVENDDESLEIDLLLKDISSAQDRVKIYDIIRENKTLKNISFLEEPLNKLIKLAEKRNLNILVYSFNARLDQINFLNDLEKNNPNFYFYNTSISEVDDERFYLHILDQHPSPFAYQIYAKEIYDCLVKFNLLSKREG